MSSPAVHSRSYRGGYVVLAGAAEVAQSDTF
jgi:hypothetical protein